MTFLLFLEILGTIAFSVSGACVAIEKKMDVFGVLILGITTAVGGGVVRDVLLNITPPYAFTQPYYALIAIVTSLIVFHPKVRGYALKENNSFLLVIDTIGLSVFTVVGVQSGMPYQNFVLEVFVGMITGVGGGVLRDIFAGNRPYIFVKHFYACASLIGSVITVLLWNSGENFAMISGAVVITVLRFLAAKYRWNLPRA